ncbi:phosphate:Na+ symporter [Pseudomonas chlororaphis]|jgi:phosphate:Na+ symporter|uniref:Na/Pi cotransporter family protein n=1 Tax=Pseudomonas chlororaphis subsp. aurantiaca TaxID=86192 RepID=A0AAJ0ZN25_9PSED|nr:Na/Pi cotransporter family protein [Pseudomonas chlororaphis]AZD45557.1 Sodium-dependent phosphate transporter [Pseudomonas chlororaphis subsp. aurantiaca]AZD64032.1 Sodium-dependent phosphate transporter [Pseudomonas chlororaphis subsp. aurantiaca]AZD76708.1 Sodium-dependent phosphate transporter [Pseudomonas chlororaphis subsp. aurantiaca]MBU4635188.1 Na/Pi cotransporter family protein [Pseudomonas chlororaphis subsp. aurantiaca]QIT20257.1 Na/Pi cotransporter family protein [Pseudomonas c
MLTLLNLLSAVALLIWGTHIVRTGILRVYGSNLRHLIGQNMAKRPLAFIAGILVTAMVQSSNATAMLVTSFVGQGLMALTPALATMLGADVGTALMARVLTFDLSWLSPLLIFLGVIFFLSRKQTRAGQLGRVGIGLGLIILALQLIVEAAAPITHAQGVKVLFASLTGDILLDALMGALFAMISYSSLAAVLLTATLAGAGVISLPVAIGLVIGANIGSGVLAFLSTNMQNAAGRQVALGSLLYKLIGLLLIIPVLDPLAHWMDSLDFSPQEVVIGFHLLYNTLRCLVLLPTVGPMAKVCAWLLPERPETNGRAKPRHLDPTALATPSLALANAARETLRIGDLIDNMLEAVRDVLHGKQTAVTQEMRNLNDDVEVLYNAIKLYLAQMPREDLSEQDSRRWAEIIELAINLKLASDLIERMLRKIQQQKTAQRRSFSEVGIEELAGLHEQLIANLRLGLSVFLSADPESARQLLREKRRFRAQERRLAHAHVSRLQRKIVQSIETSSLHLELIADMKRLNSLFCGSAYVVLGSSETGALAVDDMADITHSP